MTSVPNRIAPVPRGMSGDSGPEKMMEAMADSPNSTITAVMRPVESAVGSMGEPASARSSDASARIAGAIRVESS